MKHRCCLGVGKHDIIIFIAQNEVDTACEVFLIRYEVLVRYRCQSILCLDTLVIVQFGSAFLRLKSCVVQFYALMYHRATLGGPV